MSRRKKGRVKRCITCYTVKPMIEFYHKSNICMECDETKNPERHPHYRAMENLRRLEEEVRWKDAVIVKGYKFEGTVPEPRDVSYYTFAD